MQSKVPDKCACFPMSQVLSQTILMSKLIFVLVDNTVFFLGEVVDSPLVFYAYLLVVIKDYGQKSLTRPSEANMITHCL